MKELFAAGLGLSPEELKNAFDPKSAPDAWHAADDGSPDGKADPT
jgi:hypothetical protein